MKVGTLLLVIGDTIPYLASLGLIEEDGDVKAPNIQQGFLIAAFVEASIRKHTPKSETGKVNFEDTTKSVAEIISLLVKLFGKK